MGKESSRSGAVSQVIVIGGGAAGFFAALSVREHHPHVRVVLLEKGARPLDKVRISGGGRCNVTHDCRDLRRLAAHYPRGERFLRKAFRHFAVGDTIAWFRDRGVELKTEPDGRMFPTTDDSGTIVDALTSAADRAGVEVRLRCPVTALEPQGSRWVVRTPEGELQADRVIVASGGSPKREGLQWLADLGHAVVDPVPSLFTFNLPGDPITKLMGVVADAVTVHVAGSKLSSTGPLLVTHWGLSGPAVLRLSAWGARELQERGYRYTVRIDWTGGLGELPVRERLRDLRDTQARKLLRNADPFGLPARLWAFLLERAGVDEATVCAELPRKDLDRLVDVLVNDLHEARGKTTFKEEFVTAGGVALSEVDPDTLASRRAPGLYFAGEVLDIDGITGGFNFQAAWTTGWIAGRLA